MKVVTPGHRYEVDNFENPKSLGNPNQHIQFIEKRPYPQALAPKPGALQTICDGTTNEKLLLVLIDRLEFLGNKVPSRENSIAKIKLEEALMWLLKRTANRRMRGVEGTLEL
jgi:hypothetical protein